MYTLRFDDYEFPNQTFEVEGLPVQNDIQQDKIARKHGSIIATPYLKSRSINIFGYIHNNSADDSYSQLADMQEALLPADDGKFYYRSDRYINCKTNKIDPQFKGGTDKSVMEVDISLIADNPFQYSAGASYSVTETTDGTTTNFDVYNGGNVFSEPIYKFCAAGGTISDNLRLTNLTTGEVLRYRGDIPDGSTLEIDVENYTVKIDGVDALSYFEGDFNLLASATNSFQFVGSITDIEVEYKYRWY